MPPRCSVGKLDRKIRENEKSNLSLSSSTQLLDSATTAVPQTREAPREYMTFNKFTRDEYVLLSPLLFSRSHARSTIQLSQRPCLFAPRLLNGTSPKSTMITRPIFRTSLTYRHFSSHARSSRSIPAVLHLKTGQSFTGSSFGAPRSIFGETVFSTSITSCAR